MHRFSRVTASLIVLSLFAFMSVTFHAQDAALTQLPLLTKSNLTYLGSFALPASDGSGSEQGQFAYGGQAMSVTPQGTLLLGGHTWYSTLCEVSIPGIGGTATVLQRCTEVTEGRLGQVDGDSIEYGGSLLYGGRLILSAWSYYDADASQRLSHFVSGTTLTTAGDVVGPVQMGTAGAGFVSGYMGVIPPEWQTSFGATAMTGNCCIPIISRTSSGPALSVFNPGDVGVVAPVPATQVLGYPLDHALADAHTQNALFTNSDQVGGVAFPSGTRSVLFIGRHGSGTPCYGGGAECGDPSDPYKGQHAYPYVHQVWAYDANDLLAVKNGAKRPYDVRPYATWQLTGMNNNGGATITSAAFEPATNRIYVTEAYGNNPRVHVYQVNGGGAVATPPPPASEICGDRIDNDRDGLIDEGCAVAPPASTIPGAPTALDGRLKAGRLQLSWTPPTTGGQLTGYVLEQGTSPGGTTITRQLSATRAGASFPNPAPGKYYFRVRAANASGVSGPSNEVSVTVRR